MKSKNVEIKTSWFTLLEIRIKKNQEIYFSAASIPGLIPNHPHMDISSRVSAPGRLNFRG
jgi:hypothetical protein